MARAPERARPPIDPEEMSFSESQILKCGERCVAKEDGVNSEKMSGKNGSSGILRAILRVTGVRVAACAYCRMVFPDLFQLFPRAVAFT